MQLHLAGVVAFKPHSEIPGKRVTPNARRPLAGINSPSPDTYWRAAPGGQTRSAVKKGHNMDMRKYSGESFIKVADVRSGPLQVQIAAVKEGQYGKPNLVFESGEALGLNSTNNKILIRAYGRNSDDWIGKEIELFLGEVEYQKTMQEAVIVRPISPPLKPSAQTEAPKTDFGDETPF